MALVDTVANTTVFETVAIKHPRIGELRLSEELLAATRSRPVFP
jgi:hypothetical protein